MEIVDYVDDSKPMILKSNLKTKNSTIFIYTVLDQNLAHLGFAPEDLSRTNLQNVFIGKDNNKKVEMPRIDYEVLNKHLYTKHQQLVAQNIVHNENFERYQRLKNLKNIPNDAFVTKVDPGKVLKAVTKKKPLSVRNGRSEESKLGSIPIGTKRSYKQHLQSLVNSDSSKDTALGCGSCKRKEFSK